MSWINLATLTRDSVLIYTAVALISAIVLKYSKPYGALDADDFRSDVLKPMYDFTKMLQWPIYFPRIFGGIFRLTNLLLTWALENSFPGLVTQRSFVQVSQNPLSVGDAVKNFQRIFSLRCSRTMRFLLWHVPVNSHSLPWDLLKIPRSLIA